MRLSCRPLLFMAFVTSTFSTSQVYGQDWFGGNFNDWIWHGMGISLSHFYLIGSYMPLVFGPTDTNSS